jgi:hypothetical protein
MAKKNYIKKWFNYHLSFNNNLNYNLTLCNLFFLDKEFQIHLGDSRLKDGW